MKISAVVTCYESVNTLGLCILSLASQSSKPYEIIVTDDGSSPQTCVYVRSLLDVVKCSFGISVQFITHERTTPYRLNTIRNAGIKNATGELILLVDGDILLPAGILGSHLDIHKRMEDEGRHALVSCVRRNLGAEGEIMDGRISEWGRNLDRFLQRKKWDELDLQPEHVLSQATFLKKDWEAVGGFDVDFDGYWGFDEVEFAFRLKSAGTILTSHGMIYHIDEGPGAGNRDCSRNRALYEEKKRVWQQ